MLHTVLLLLTAMTTADPTATPVSARIIVKLPAAARLYVDDALCPLTSDTRSFDTPKLKPGKQYYYLLRAELVRDGKTVSDTKKALVQASETTTVDFGDLKPAVATPSGKASTAADKPAGEATGSDEKNKEGFKLSKEEQAVLDLTNKERAAAGLKPLKPNEKLCQAARGHSANMAKQDVIAHTLDGKGPGERLKEVGYQSAGWGENCAAGQRTAAEALSSWMNSPGHRANILGSYQEIGIGLAKSAGGTTYWTQVFANPADR